VRVIAIRISIPSLSVHAAGIFQLSHAIIKLVCGYGWSPESPSYRPFAIVLSSEMVLCPVGADEGKMEMAIVMVGLLLLVGDGNL
jgi:hypothetical protein